MCEADNFNQYMHLIGDKTDCSHQEANVKLVSHFIEMYPQRKHIQVLADDTDMFVLFLFRVVIQTSDPNLNEEI